MHARVSVWTPRLRGAYSIPTRRLARCVGVSGDDELSPDRVRCSRAVSKSRREEINDGEIARDARRALPSPAAFVQTSAGLRGAEEEPRPHRRRCDSAAVETGRVTSNVKRIAGILLPG